jgi:hypothetical protein
MAKARAQWRAAVIMAMRFRVSSEKGNSLSSRTNLSFSRTTLLLGVAVNQNDCGLVGLQKAR